MKFIEKFKLEIITIIVFSIYITTLAPGIIQIDTGELAAVATTLGIAHPSGYPLFTVLGFLLTKILYFIPAIYAMNIFAAINTSLAFYFLTKFNFVLIKDFILDRSKNKKEKISTKNKKKAIDKINIDINENLIFLFSIVAALSIAFSETFWSQGTAVEVYSLHLTLLSLSLFLFIKAVSLTPQEVQLKFNFKTEKHWIIFSFFYGLSFTNHLTTFLTIPAFIFLYFYSYKLNKYSLKRALILIIPFLVGLMFYLYLPIRAAQDPMLNWGNPVTFENMIRHIRGWQYTVWMFSSFDVSIKQLGYFLKNLPAEFGYIGLFFILAGVIYLYRRNKIILWFLLILIIFTILYAINYDIKDIDSYFLLAYISSSPLIAISLIWIYDKIKIENKILKNSVLFLIPIIILVLNYKLVDESDNKQIHQYSKIVLDSFEKNSLVLSYLWDFFISPTYYLQYVENQRKDVIIIDKELVRRSWYFNQIRRNYPDIYEKIKPTVQLFLVELEKFENNKNYNAMLLDKYFNQILVEIITTNINTRPVYIGTEIVVNEMRENKIKLPDSLDIVPMTFFFKVVKKNERSYYECPPPDFQIEFRNKNDYYTQTLKNLISISLLNRATYEENFKQSDKAKLFLAKALEVNPLAQVPNELLKLLGP